MSNFQRRHYELLAEVLAHSNASKMIVLQMCSMLRQDNHRFNEVQFMTAIDNYRMAGDVSGI
tara:strand:- start:2108 stop:2293 length:186 start_codon:yes stop_codon:yes gene_type:complete